MMESQNREWVERIGPLLIALLSWAMAALVAVPILLVALLPFLG